MKHYPKCKWHTFITGKACLVRRGKQLLAVDFLAGVSLSHPPVLQSQVLSRALTKLSRIQLLKTTFSLASRDFTHGEPRLKGFFRTSGIAKMA